MSYLQLLLGLLLVSNLVLLALAALLLQRRFDSSSQVDVLAELASHTETLQQSLSGQFSSATADMAQRLERTKGDLLQQVSDRLGEGLCLLGNVV
ncbi:MAG: hypothetical protein LAO09_19570 [Acidobacteriia bacterium]|nr:hypothetical protein [Terriglobia bacterium]